MRVARPATVVILPPVLLVAYLTLAGSGCCTTRLRLCMYASDVFDALVAQMCLRPITLVLPLLLELSSANRTSALHITTAYVSILVPIRNILYSIVQGPPHPTLTSYALVVMWPRSTTTTATLTWGIRHSCRICTLLVCAGPHSGFVLSPLLYGSTGCGLLCEYRRTPRPMWSRTMHVLRVEEKAHKLLG